MRTGLIVVVAILAIAGCEKSAPWPADGVFSGYYQWGFERSDFKPAGTTERWWVAGNIAPLRQSSSPETVYIVIRGTLSPKSRYGHLDQYKRELTVEEVIEMRELRRDEKIQF